MAMKSPWEYFTTIYHKLKNLEILAKKELFERKRTQPSNYQVKQENPVVFWQDIKQNVGIKDCFIKPRLGRTKIMALKRNREIIKTKRKNRYRHYFFYAIAQMEQIQEVVLK